MKKFIAIFLAAVMCVALVACGSGDDVTSSDENSKDDTSQESQSSTINNTELISAWEEILFNNVWYGKCHGGEYNDIIEFVFYEDGSYSEDGNKDGNTWQFSCVYEDATEYLENIVVQTLPDYDAEKGLYVSSDFTLGITKDGKYVLRTHYDYICYTQDNYEEVEITLDNWQDYFELREDRKFSENAFGEFAELYTSYYLVAKDGIVVEQSKSDIAVEYSTTYERRPYTIDFENKNIAYGDAIETLSSGPYIKEMGNSYLWGADESWYGIYVDASAAVQLQGDDAKVVIGVDIIRIKGSICVRR